MWIADIDFSGALTAGGHITLAAGKDLLGSTTSDLGASGTRLQKLWIAAIDVSGALTAGGNLSIAAGKNLLLNGSGAPADLVGIALKNGTAATETNIDGISAWAADQADGGAQLAKSELVIMNEGLTKYHIGGGASADEDVRVGGSLPDAADFTTSTKAGATGVLKTFTIPANLLGVNGKALRVTAWGTKSGANATATLQTRTGTTPTSRFSTIISISTTREWRIEIYIVRTSATAANISFRFNETHTLIQDLAANENYGLLQNQTASSGTNWAAAQIIDFNVSAINGGDTVTQEGLIVELLN